MKHRHCSIAALLVAFGPPVRVGHAFTVRSTCLTSTRCRSACKSSTSNCGSNWAILRPAPGAAALSMAWSAQERMDILSGLVDWQERDIHGIGAADIKILTETCPTAVLTRYYESLAAGEAQQMLLVAPSCSIESNCAKAIEAALSSACVSRVYHPDVAQGLGGKAPHLALWHEQVSADVFSPGTALEQQTTALPQKAVMEEVFLWLQRKMLGMADDEEEIFVDLGRKLLTVHKAVVVNAVTEAELSRIFWQEVVALVKHGVTAAAAVATTEKEENAKTAAAERAPTQSRERGEGETAVEDYENAEEDVLKASGLEGGNNPKEDSVLLVLPGFRFKDRISFEEFVEDKLAAPLKALSPLGVEGVELSADIYAGEDLKFPVIILSPPLEKFRAPEGGYKFINGRGEEQDADSYIQVQEIKLAQQAAARAKQQQQHPDPLFGPRPPGPEQGDLV